MGNSDANTEQPVCRVARQISCRNRQQATDLTATYAQFLSFRAFAMVRFPRTVKFPAILFLQSAQIARSETVLFRASGSLLTKKADFR